MQSGATYDINCTNFKCCQIWKFKKEQEGFSSLNCGGGVGSILPNLPPLPASYVYGMVQNNDMKEREIRPK